MVLTEAASQYRRATWMSTGDRSAGDWGGGSKDWEHSTGVVNGGCLLPKTSSERTSNTNFEE